MHLQHHDIKKTKPNVTCTLRNTPWVSPRKPSTYPTLQTPRFASHTPAIHAHRSTLRARNSLCSHSTLHTPLVVHSSQPTHSTFYTSQSTYTTLPIPHFTLDTSRSPLAPLFMPHAPHAPHSKSTLYIPHSTLYTWHSTLYTLHKTF